MITTTANDSKLVLGTDKYGKIWSAKIQPDGTQIWTQVRDGKIVNAGVNQAPKQFNSETGLSSPTKIKQ